MEETKKRVDDLLQKLYKYEQGVKDLRETMWERLGKLNSNKEFYQLHKDHIRKKRLTKLEEIIYVLSVIEEIDGDRSAEVEKVIDNLKKANEGLMRVIEKLVPIFSGTDPDLRVDVYKLIASCRLAERELLTDDNQSTLQNVIECIKQRFLGISVRKYSK